jgi:hypothetical protein
MVNTSEESTPLKAFRQIFSELDTTLPYMNQEM